MMSKAQIDRTVRLVCNAEWRCPIFDAGAQCDCNEGKTGDCPLRHALEIANEIDATTAKAVTKEMR